MNTSSIFNTLVNAFYDDADERIRDKIFMGYPYQIIVAYVCYLVIILWLLPLICEYFKPLNYRKCMTIVDVILCLRAFYFLVNFSYLWFFEYNWICQPIDRSGSWLSNFELNISYQYVILKFLYTLQSFVFVVSKKNSPVATYLLVHHTIFPIMLWMAANFYPGGHSTFIGFINSFVHFSVTGMRILTVAFPNLNIGKKQKSLDIGLHLFQFAAFFVHSSVVVYNQDCGVPKILAFLEVLSTVVIAVIYKIFVLDSWKDKEKPKESVGEEKA